MTVDLKVPPAGESIVSVVVSEWLAQPGGQVRQGDVVVLLETDKVNLEVPAPTSGTITEILKKAGDSAAVGDVLAHMEEGEVPPAPPPAEPAPAPQAKPAPASVPAPAASPVPVVAPAARRLMAREKVETGDLQGSGRGGRILKEDVLRHLQARTVEPTHPATAPFHPAAAPQADERLEEVKPMSPLRQKIAQRLVQAQQTAALLTTFNEVDMFAVMELRRRYQEDFRNKHGVKLGFMSFFVKAAVEALKAFPAINAEIRDQALVYRNYYDIGVAVGGGKGLVVPVLREADRLSFAEIEVRIKDFAQRAAAMKLSLEELEGGTFTISNGGIYGSMLSTPIVNPPQSGILGLHNIVDRPVAVDGQVVVRPVMYLALTYDHRVVDGREAVSFLIRIKQCIENPARMLLEV